MKSSTENTLIPYHDLSISKSDGVTIPFLLYTSELNPYAYFQCKSNPTAVSI
jgi:hypothetical protein